MKQREIRITIRNAIYGAGSLGTILGAYITCKGGRIDLINRNVKHVEALSLLILPIAIIHRIEAGELRPGFENLKLFLKK